MDEFPILRRLRARIPMVVIMARELKPRLALPRIGGLSKCEL